MTADAVAVDTSALIAILMEEPEAVALRAALDAATALHMSAASKAEAGIVATQRGMLGDLLDLVAAYGISIEPVDDKHAGLAIEAFRRFGKGRHPARLNLGDCYAYALARDRNLPLLCTGNDFRQTGLRTLP